MPAGPSRQRQRRDSAFCSSALLDAPLDVADRVEVFGEPVLIGRPERPLQPRHFLRHRVENAAVVRHLRQPLARRCRPRRTAARTPCADCSPSAAASSASATTACSCRRSCSRCRSCRRGRWSRARARARRAGVSVPSSLRGDLIGGGPELDVGAFGALRRGCRSATPRSRASDRRRRRRTSLACMLREPADDERPDRGTARAGSASATTRSRAPVAGRRPLVHASRRSACR